MNGNAILQYGAYLSRINCTEDCKYFELSISQLVIKRQLNVSLKALLFNYVHIRVHKTRPSSKTAYFKLFIIFCYNLPLGSIFCAVEYFCVHCSTISLHRETPVVVDALPVCNVSITHLVGCGLKSDKSLNLLLKFLAAILITNSLGITRIHNWTYSFRM